jgi:hypothetical protein
MPSKDTEIRMPAVDGHTATIGVTSPARTPRPRK